MVYEWVGVLAGVLLIAALALIAVRARAIDKSGALTGSLITFATFISGGFSWLFVTVVFFVVSSVLTRFRYDYKLSIGSAQEKGGTRSWPNTLANGLISAVAATAYLVFRQEIFAIAFLGAVAVAMSDTIATEVGLLSNSKPRSITNPSKIVEPGTSGGVSALGELAALASSLGIGLLGLVIGVVPFGTSIVVPFALSVTFGGIVGTNIDSLLGGTIQAQRRCVQCDLVTESKAHHGRPTAVVRGNRYVDNNVVNFVAIALGSLVAIAIYLFA